MGETEGSRIGDARAHHNRDRGGRTGGGPRARCGVGHNEIDREVRQFLGQPRQGGGIAMGEAVFEDDVAALDITELAQPLPKRLEDQCRLVLGWRQNADTGDFVR